MLYIVFNQGIENYIATNGIVQAGHRVFQDYATALNHATNAGSDFKVYGVLVENGQFVTYDDLPQPNCVLLVTCPLVFVEDQDYWILHRRDTQVDVYNSLLERMGVIHLSILPHHIQVSLNNKESVRVKLIEF